MATKRIQATVSGEVQGVGYRYYATRIAHELGLKGSVRNLPSGDVEAIAEGEEASLANFIDNLRSGPSTAHVANVQVAWGEAEGKLSDFTAVS